MPQNPRDRFEFVIETLAQDFAAGRTIGALHDWQEKHETKDEQRFERIEERLDSMDRQREREAGRAEGQQAAAATRVVAFPTGEAGPMGTGKFQIIPIASTPPPPPSVHVDVHAPATPKSHHSSRPSILAGVVGGAMKKAAPFIGSGIVAWAIGYFHGTATAEKPHEQPMPAMVREQPHETPLPTAPATSSVEAPIVKRDGGR